MNGDERMDLKLEQIRRGTSLSSAGTGRCPNEKRTSRGSRQAAAYASFSFSGVSFSADRTILSSSPGVPGQAT
jgi:hypothetical protein